MFLIHSDEALEIKKFKRSRENKIEFAYDYRNLNATNKFTQTICLNVILEKIIIDLEDEVVNLLEKEKTNLETIESLKSKGCESSETVVCESENQNENDCHEIEKEYDKEENPKVIAPGMFKLSVSQCVSPISMSKLSCDYKNVEIKLKRKSHKRKSLKQNVKQVDNDVSRANNDFIHFSDLNTFSSVRRPKNSGVIWKKKGSANTYNICLSAVSVSNLNKNVKRYSCKDLLACNNSYLGETSSAYMCNDAMNVFCGSRMNHLLDDNNLFIFDDESIKISPVSKTPFKKKPFDSMNVRSKSNLNKSLPRTMHKWLPRLQPLAEPVAKWFPRIVRICIWIIDSGCSKHMTGNRALLTNFIEKFLGTVRFSNNDFAVIAGYGDVYTWVFFRHSKDEASKVIISFIKKTQVNLQLQVQRVRTDNGTEFKNKTLATFFDEAEAIATACFTQNFLIIHKHFDKTPYELMNKRKPNIKFFRVFGCRCYLLNDDEDVGKLKENVDIGVFIGYSKESDAFRIYNKRTRKIHERVNVNFDEISEMDYKQFSLEPGLSNLNETGKSSNQSVSQVSEISKKDLEYLFQDFYDEYFDSSKIMKSSTTNVETSINEEVFHEVSESFQRESSLSSLNDDVQQSPEEVILPQTNTQSISNNMILLVMKRVHHTMCLINDWRMLILMLVHRFMIYPMFIPIINLTHMRRSRLRIIHFIK
nr:hypothetical protein [Tanacetum cinerariifolium]